MFVKIKFSALRIGTLLAWTRKERITGLVRPWGRYTDNAKEEEERILPRTKRTHTCGMFTNLRFDISAEAKLAPADGNFVSFSIVMCS